jgi:alanyl-tRNA synthetase
VTAERLRFDFSHYSAVTADELHQIEQLVNAQVRANASVETRLMNQEAAVAAGAMALFGEKYDDEVRVLRIGDFSMELCGGTHAARAGDIGLFKIVSEGGVAAGVRRIEAVTGQGALDWVSNSEALLRELAVLVKGSREDVTDKVRLVLDRSRKIEKELGQLKSKLASGQGNDLTDSAREVAGTRLVTRLIEGADVSALRAAVDQLKDKLKSAVVVLASVVENDKVVIIAGVTQDQITRFKAGEIANYVAQQVGGRGGGRPDMAQAGGTEPAKLPAALDSVAEWLEGRLR